MEEKVIRSRGEVIAYEIEVGWNGWSFHIFYGQHHSAWFISVLNWGIAIEATEPTNIYYNIDKLSQAFNDHDKGKNVAEAIKEHWESINR